MPRSPEQALGAFLLPGVPSTRPVPWLPETTGDKGCVPAAWLLTQAPALQQDSLPLPPVQGVN